MSQVSEITQGYILHSRSFKETSLILDAFTLEHGRVSLIAKGAKSSNKKNNRKALLQSFQPLSLSWFGRSDLKTVKLLEASGLPLVLNGLSNLCGLYLNELLLKLLHPWDPNRDLYQAYATSLKALSTADSPAAILREFELYLLDCLGYGVSWEHDVYGDAIEPTQMYAFQVEQGFVPHLNAAVGATLYAGDKILAVSEYHWTSQGALTTARMINRKIIEELLGNKTLNSRKLLQQTLAITQ